MKHYIPLNISEFSDSALIVVWEDGHESIYPYEDLRQICPCATCRRLREKSKTGKLPLKKAVLQGQVMDIKPKEIQPVGRYAVRFVWNDGHDTGIYTYEFLRRNCMCEKCVG